MTVLGRRGAADLLDGDLSVLIRLFYLLSANNSPVLDCIDNATLDSHDFPHFKELVLDLTDKSEDVQKAFEGSVRSRKHSGSESELKELMESFNNDGNGTLEWNEFLFAQSCSPNTFSRTFERGELRLMWPTPVRELAVRRTSANTAARMQSVRADGCLRG
eukprot:1421797-Rhodomonas_salina.1